MGEEVRQKGGGGDFLNCFWLLFGERKRVPLMKKKRRRIFMNRERSS